MLKHIQIIPLVIGLIIGIIAIVVAKPQMNITYKYPTPETADKIVYKDKNGICYKYKSTQVDCDKNESRLKEFPINK